MQRGISTLAMIGIWLWASSAHGQILRRGYHGFAASYTVIDFDFAGDENASFARYDYQGPAFGISYATSNLRGLVAFGRADTDRSLVDISVSGWALLEFSESAVAATQLGVPIGILVGWRRVTVPGGFEPYGVSSIAAGAGGSLQHNFNAVSRVSLRASPFLGITGSALTDQVGFSWMAEGDAQLEFDEIAGDVGLLIGYTLRYQVWNVNGSSTFTSAVDNSLDYNGLMHVFRAGLKF